MCRGWGLSGHTSEIELLFYRIGVSGGVLSSHIKQPFIPHVTISWIEDNRRFFAVRNLDHVNQISRGLFGIYSLPDAYCVLVSLTSLPNANHPNARYAFHTLQTNMISSLYKFCRNASVFPFLLSPPEGNSSVEGIVRPPRNQKMSCACPRQSGQRDNEMRRKMGGAAKPANNRARSRWRHGGASRGVRKARRRRPTASGQ